MELSPPLPFLTPKPPPAFVCQSVAPPPTPLIVTADEIVPPVLPLTLPSRESSPAATVPAAVPTFLVALSPKPTFYRLLSSGLADNFT
nr:MAG TPA_asm: hypothetical protein [Caudoviricetes sp.]